MNSKPFMTVQNGKGEEIQLELVDTVSVDNNNYVIVSEIGEDDAFAYRTIEKSGKTDYISIGNGPEFKMVLKEYNRKNKE